jgi:hypothetical protein
VVSILSTPIPIMRTSQDLPKKDSKALTTAGDKELHLSNIDADPVEKFKSSVVGQVEDLDEGSNSSGSTTTLRSTSRSYFRTKHSTNDLSERLTCSCCHCCGSYFLQVIDKQAMSYSAVFDLFDTTGITGDQYSWLGSIFYFAYLVFEWPSAYLAQHFPTGRIVSTYRFCWGTVMICTAATHNFAGFAAMRFLLGIFQSVYVQ